MKSGRPPISDDEKKRRGTYDKRWSADARAARAEEKVVSLFGADSLRAIPDPPDGLSGKAEGEYRLWCRRLLDVGRLSSVWVEKITLYAIRKHSIETRLAEGKSIKDGDVRGCAQFLKELEALNIDAPRDGQEAPKSIWSSIGFASRASVPSKRGGK